MSDVTNVIPKFDDLYIPLKTTIYENVENEDGSIVCVQWHPERMQDMEMYRKLFRDFAEKCR